MRLLIQRVAQASVTVDGETVASIGRGLLVLCGVGRGDTPEDAHRLAGKTARLRIFEDAEGKMNLALDAVAGEVLVVSQFTLYGDCRKGNRPSYIEAAAPEEGDRLYQEYVAALRGLGIPVQTGIFRAMMKVALVNDGPVTLWLDSADLAGGGG
ncbi:MAG TPA: D-aminoacyl-tRNA deacylase [Kiritimatiellia bacterium]|nr:D-aminoacyl-tRNA deacylase [Kiritimatiellia bacterium]HMO98803.1 D-aminoacyl-tRNA deacylase [Kiritimatiellia bacterium]HMP96864.1 D-aminoacyl-tRNA deacylase [Kiritimatiellia bacterium]